MRGDPALLGLPRISKTVHRIRWAALSAQKLRSSALVTLSCSCNNQVSYFLKERPCSLSNYTKGALLYGVIPVCALCETEHPGHLNVRGVLRHCVPNKGLRSLAPLCGYPCRLGQQKRFCKPFPLTKFSYRKSDRQ